MANQYPINPMYLLGHTFDFVELFHAEVGPTPVRFTARVLAVQVPLPRSPISWGLLLEDSKFGLLDHYVSLDDLHFDWPVGFFRPPSLKHRSNSGRDGRGPGAGGSKRAQRA